VSDFIKNKVLNHSPKRPHDVSTIYNVPITRGNALNEAQLTSLRENKKPFQLVFVGQITEQKGIVELVKALIQMNDGNIGAWIVGGGAHSLELENELQAIVLASETRTCIEFFGYQSDPRPFYAAADWHIAPSTYEEPMANTTFEAKIGAIPSIVSNLGGFPEVIQHKYDGWILPEANAIQIQKCLMKSSNWKVIGCSWESEQESPFRSNTIIKLSIISGVVSLLCKRKKNLTVLRILLIKNQKLKWQYSGRTFD